MIKHIQSITNRVNAPEVIFQRMINFLSGERRTAFFVALSTGILTHLMLMILMPFIGDSTHTNIFYYRYHEWELMNLGRYGWRLTELIRHSMIFPQMIVIVCIFLLSISVTLLVDIFHIKGNIFAGIVAASVVTSPVFGETISFYFSAEPFCVAMLTGIASVFIIRNTTLRTGWKIFASGVLICLTISMYQAYIGVPLALFLFCLIYDLLEVEKKREKTYIRFFEGVVASIFGAILYTVILKIILFTTNTQLASYGGANQIGFINTVAKLPSRIKQTYLDFWEFLFGGLITNNAAWNRVWMWTVILSAVAIIWVIRLYGQVHQKKMLVKDAVALTIMLFITPVAFNFIDIIATERNINTLMAAAMTLIIPMICVLICHYKDLNLLRCTVMLLTIVIIWTNILENQAYYTTMHIVENRGKMAVENAVERVTSDEAFLPDMPVLFVGAVTNSIYQGSFQPAKMCSYVSPFVWDEEQISWESWQLVLENYYGIQMNFCTEEEMRRTIETEPYQEMGTFPAADSTRIIDGIYVVKFSDELPYPK